MALLQACKSVSCTLLQDYELLHSHVRAAAGRPHLHQKKKNLAVAGSEGEDGTPMLFFCAEWWSCWVAHSLARRPIRRGGGRGGAEDRGGGAVDGGLGPAGP